MYCFDIKGLSSVSATYNKVLTDEDVAIIRNDFMLSYNRGYMEKVATNVIVFMVPTSMAHTILWHLKNKPLPSQQEGREKFIELLDRISDVDVLQIVVQDKIL
jgi:predicted SprT family Zn-dependent metalloprotease